MTDYKRGRVATVEIASSSRLLGIRGVGGWYSDKFGFTPDGNVTDVRPLVVLDLDWAESVPVLIAQLRGAGYVHIADQIEAQTKPPRIPEPGLWGVVEAAVPESGGSRWPFVHDTDQGSSEWTCVNDGDHYDWDALIDPVLIREGVA
jgi:hypothetical protein